MKKIHFVFFCLIAFSSPAQKLNLDSLWKIWSNPAQPDTAKLKVLQAIAEGRYLNSNSDSALYAAQMEYNLAVKADNKKYQGLALKLQGNYFYRKGENYRAIDFFKRSLAIQEAAGNKKEMADLLSEMGDLKYSDSEYAKALEYLSRSQNIYEEIKNDRGIASVEMLIADIYFYQGEFNKTLDFCQRSLIVSQRMGDQRLIASNLGNIGSTYKSKGEYEKAIDYTLKSLAIEEKIQDSLGAAISLGNLGEIYVEKGDYANAMTYFKNSLQLSEELDDKEGIANSNNNIGGAYYRQGNYKKAIEYGKKGLQVAQDAGVKIEIKTASNLLFESYQKTGKEKDALEMYKLYIATRDTIMNTANQKALIRQELKLNYEKQTALDKKENEKQLIIAEEKQNKQRIFIIAISLGLLLVIIFSIILFNRFLLTRKQKVVIEKQKKIVEEKNKQVTDSINYARSIQRALLASDTLLKQNLPDYFILYKPKDIVSGDFYWATKLEPKEEKEQKGNSKFILITADCTGHGVPGAFMSLLNISKLNEAINEKKIEEPHLILNHVKEEIVKALNPEGSEDTYDGMDCILCAFDFKAMQLQYAAANNSFYIVRNNELITCKPDKMSVGKSHIEGESFTLHTIQLQKGDVIYTLTDGYSDQFGGANGKKFMYKQLEKTLLSCHQKPLAEQKKILNETIEKWKGNLEQVDDILVIGIKV